MYGPRFYPSYFAFSANFRQIKNLVPSKNEPNRNELFSQKTIIDCFYYTIFSPQNKLGKRIENQTIPSRIMTIMIGIPVRPFKIFLINLTRKTFRPFHSFVSTYGVSNY